MSKVEIWKETGLCQRANPIETQQAKDSQAPCGLQGQGQAKAERVHPTLSLKGGCRRKIIVFVCQSLLNKSAFLFPNPSTHGGKSVP